LFCSVLSCSLFFSCLKKNTLWIVITCGYSWSFHYETEMKYPACNRKHLCHQDQKQCACHKPQYRQCYHHKGTVHPKFLEQSQIANNMCYSDTMAKLHESICCKNKNSDAWFLHYDIVPTHVMFASWAFLDRQSIITSTIQHIHRYGPVKLLTAPRTEDHFEAPQIFAHADIQGHEKTILKSMPEECFQL